MTIYVVILMKPGAWPFSLAAYRDEAEARGRALAERAAGHEAWTESVTLNG